MQNDSPLVDSTCERWAGAAMATKKAPGEKKRMVVTLVDPNAIEPWVEDFLRRVEENDVNGVKTVVSARRDAVGVHNAVRLESEAEDSCLHLKGEWGTPWLP
uniref:Uncharacterized protein n=1 Tax=Plectus sambesii TaxID=2011161 RepID=A0A914VYS9_9BILA